MISCEHLNDYRDGKLSPLENNGFDAHLLGCDSCRMSVERWAFVKQEIIDIIAEDRNQMELTNQLCAARIEAAFENDIASKHRVRRWVLAAAAVLLLGLGIGIWMQRGPGLAQTEPPVVQNAPVSGLVISDVSPIQKTWQPGETIRTPRDNRALLTVDSATVGVDKNSAVAVYSSGEGDTRIQLQRGRMVARVAKRKQGDRFIVDAGRYSVRVVGTVFSVQTSPGETIVSVSHGAVDVLQNEQVLSRVKTGASISLLDNGEHHLAKLDKEELSQMETLLSKEQPNRGKQASTLVETSGEKKVNEGTSTPPSREHSNRAKYEQWESALIEGRYDDTRKELQRHLHKARQDTRAWALLGNCENRAKNWDGSIAAYKQVITKGNNREARTARFKVGVIYQEKLGKHVAAEKMFREFVASGPSQTLMAQGKLRQARSLLAMGKTDQAHALLQNIASQFAGSTAADQAKKMLDKNN